MSARQVSWRIFLILALHSCGLAHAGSPGGIGVLGDSYSDEYQFYPPDRSKARNWVEILAATRGLDFGPFTSHSRGEPRNQGFAYNWARSDATTEDMIKSGQHTGLAQQVARGHVKLVCIIIGGNDFIKTMKSPDPLSEVDVVLPRALHNYRTAVGTILGASSDVKLVVVTLPDIRFLPEFAQPIRCGRIPAAVVDSIGAAMKQFNHQLRLLASENPRISLVDCDRVARLADLVSHDYMCVAGRLLDRKTPGNDLDHFFLEDGRHPGVLGQYLIAKMIVDAVNARFGAGISPLDNEELIAFASSLPRVLPASMRGREMDEHGRRGGRHAGQSSDPGVPGG